MSASRKGYRRTQAQRFKQSELMTELWRKRRGAKYAEAEARLRLWERRNGLDPRVFSDPSFNTKLREAVKAEAEGFERQAEYKRHLAALQDPETGPHLLNDAIDVELRKVAANMDKFGLDERGWLVGQGVFKPPPSALSSMLTAPYGEFRDPIEVTLSKLRELLS